MAKGLNHFFRHASCETLASVLAGVGALTADFRPTMSDAAKVTLALDLTAKLGAAERKALLTAVGDIEALTSDLGVVCLRDADGPQADIVARFAILQSNHDRAAWMWLHRREQFEHALARMFFDAREDSRTLSSAFKAPEDAKYAGDLDELRLKLSDLFAEDFGGAPKVKVERFDLTADSVLLSMFFEGLSTTKLVFEDAQKLGVEIRQNVHHAAVKIDPGVVTIVTDQMGEGRRSAIAQVVAQTGLGLSGALARLPPVEYDLKRLLDRAPFKLDGAEVFVTMLKLAAPAWGNVTKTYRNSGRVLSDVREMVLNDIRFSDRSYVAAGEMRVAFAPGPGRPRERRVSVGFSGPHTCRIGHTTQEHELVRVHCLKQWRLVLLPRDRKGPGR